MKKIIFIGLMFLCSAGYAAEGYFGILKSTTAGIALMRIAGRVEVAESSTTVDTQKIILHGPNKRITVRDGFTVSTMTQNGFYGNVLEVSTITITHMDVSSITATGSITANTFHGDGASITNLTANQIAAGSLDNDVIISSIAVGAVDNSNQIVNGIISNDDLAGSIADSKLNQITTDDKVATAAIATGVLPNDVIASSIAVNTVHTAGVQDDAIDKDKLNVAAIDSDGKVSAITATEFASLDGASITNLTANQIAAGSLDSDVIISSIAAGAVDNSNQIVNGIISNDDLAGSISQSKITDLESDLALKAIMADVATDTTTIAGNVSDNDTDISNLHTSTATLETDKVPYSGATGLTNLGAYGLNTSSDIVANEFHGDGSNLTGISGTDNLGNHVATTTLNMVSFDIVNIGSMTVDNGEGGISIATSFNPVKRYSGNNGVAIGKDTYDNYASGVGIGPYAYGNHDGGVGIGSYAQDNYSHGIGIGVNTKGNHTYGIGIGLNSQYNDNYAIGVGMNTKFIGNRGIGIGAYAYASSSSVALGDIARANAKESLALGAGTINNSTGTANFGVYSIHTTSDVIANSYFGNGANLTGIGASAADNLGNHIATMTLQMGAYGINTSSDITSSIFKLSGNGIEFKSMPLGLHIGNAAGTTTGNYSHIIGYDAGKKITTAHNSMCFGPLTCGGQSTGNFTGNNNTAMGVSSGGKLESGAGNTLLGAACGRYITSGGQNLFFGYYPGDTTTTGSRNIILSNSASGINAPAVGSNDYLNIGNAISGYMLASGTMTFIGYIQAKGYSDASWYSKTKEQAYAVVNSMKSDSMGGIDHDAMDDALKTSYDEKVIDRYEIEITTGGIEVEIPVYKTITKTGRNISASISAINEVVKDLILRIAVLEAK